MHAATLPPLALTMGDPGGIGGEIALRAWARLRGKGPCFLVLDDPGRLNALARCLGLGEVAHAIGSAGEARVVFPRALPVLPVPLGDAASLGRPSPGHAGAILQSIERAVTLTLAGETAAVVTNPVAKSALAQAGFPHPGHTEFLGALTGVERPVMMLAAPGLRVVPVTVHVALRQAIEDLDQDAILRVARVTAAALRRDFGIAAPRLAVTGLNPHAGEEGRMGREEIGIIKPAIAVLRGEGVDASGPHPADSLFAEHARGGYDAAICMYHDQALIPLKTLDMRRGVNVTLGLPIIRTSPDHGTAFDIASDLRANPESLIAALRLAGGMASGRKA